MIRINPSRPRESAPGERDSLRCRRGQALAEAALVVPILLLILLGLIESGHGLVIKHKMVVLSREGANIASRGSSLEETLEVVMSQGGEIALTHYGGAVVSRISVIEGTPIVEARVSYPGFENASRLGQLDSVAAPLVELSLSEGQVLYAVEILYNYQALTPVGALLPEGWAEGVYERAIF